MIGDFGTGYSSFTHLKQLPVVKLGCDEMQGYLLAKLGPPEEITRMIEESRSKSTSRAERLAHVVNRT